MKSRLFGRLGRFVRVQNVVIGRLGRFVDLVKQYFPPSNRLHLLTGRAL